MCRECVKEECPERESVCLDTGSYLLNYRGCTQCSEGSAITIINRETVEDELGEESTTYQHACSNCNHVIADHEHTFRVEDDFQMYEMYCLLCGRGEDQRSVMPWDPRGPKE